MMIRTLAEVFIIDLHPELCHFSVIQEIAMMKHMYEINKVQLKHYHMQDLVETEIIDSVFHV